MLPGAGTGAMSLDTVAEGGNTGAGAKTGVARGAGGGAWTGSAGLG